MLQKRKHISYPMLIALGFFMMILVGTLLLMLPFSAANGEPVGAIDAMFTAVSASCVTGLVVFDTFTQWSLFGQIVILVLIQIGGLGFMTIITMFSLFLRRRIGLTERSLMRESINAMYVGGIVRLTRRVLFGTLLFESAGAVLLAFRFVPRMGLGEGIYCAVFHSISAFCNAGFDLMGRYGKYSSLVSFADDGLVIGVISALIVIGGIGFFVWDDVHDKKWHFSRYRLHTKIVLVTTALLLVIPTLLFWLFERGGLFSELSGGGQFWASLFSAVTPRTAGFNSVDTAALTPASKLLTMILMFIGGSPGSTAGGIKTTTLAILLVTIVASIRNESVNNVFGRRLEDNAFKRAAAVFAVNFSFVLFATLVIGAVQPELLLSDVLFEAFSAIGTVGMSTGITRDLIPLSRVIIALLMYAGRVGSLSFALMFTEYRQVPAVRMPVEKINIG